MAKWEFFQKEREYLSAKDVHGSTLPPGAASSHRGFGAPPCPLCKLGVLPSWAALRAGCRSRTPASFSGESPSSGHRNTWETLPSSNGWRMTKAFTLRQDNSTAPSRFQSSRGTPLWPAQPHIYLTLPCFTHNLAPYRELPP